METLEQFFRVTSTLPQPMVRVSWHGGEPLLAGKDFFRHVVRLENQYPDKKWLNCVQTNAVLIDDEWSEIFCDGHFGIGVSIDGTEEAHNTNRVNVAGHGSYQHVIKGVSVLRKHGNNPGVICTVTKKTVERGREMFLGLTDAGFKSINFNAFYNTASMHDCDEYGLSSDEWSKFLIDVFEAWLNLNDPTVRVREIDGILAWTKNKVMSECSFKGTCHSWFVIDSQGDIYPCERYGKEVCFGNINSITSFSEVTKGAVFISRLKTIRKLPNKCLLCSLQPMCHNGCVSHRQLDEEGVLIYTYCESRLGLYEYIRQRLACVKGQ